MHFTFESLASFARSASRCPNMNDEAFLRQWTGQTYREAIHDAIHGDTAVVPEAEKLLSTLETTIELKSRQWRSDITGMYPCVPDYLQGHPECMRRLDNAPAENTPVRIWVCTSSSSAVSHQILTKRGIAALAAVMALSQIRPIELWTFTHLDGHRHTEDTCCIKVRINSAPLQLSEACVALASVAFDRGLTHNYAKQHDDYRGGWGVEPITEAGCRKLLQAAPDDLVIPPSHISDTRMLTDPVGWVKSVLDKFANQQSEEYA